MHRGREDKCLCGVTRAQAPAAKAKHQPAITAVAAARQPDTGMRTAALAVSARVSSVYQAACKHQQQPHMLSP